MFEGDVFEDDDDDDVDVDDDDIHKIELEDGTTRRRAEKR